MSKLPIRIKVIAVTAFLLVMMAGMGAVALLKMRTINASTVDIATSWLPSVRVLGDLRVEALRYRAALRDHLLAETADQKAAAEKRMNEMLEQVIPKTLKEYEPLITSPEERAIYEEWARLWNEYLKGARNMIEVSRQSVGRPAHEAYELLTKTYNKTALDSDAVLQKGIDLNNKGSEKATQDAAAGYTMAFALVVGFTLVALLGGVIAAFLLVRDLSRGIASIITPMQALSGGDLSAEVPHRGESNEIGAMADALQVFKEALVAKKAADEAAARDAEAKIERARRVDAITRGFETVIGEIVRTVSSASTELEASAGSLTATANRSQHLATTVASASEEASANVQSVAAATEQLSSSVTEISRQVQDSARMASDAVEQARRTNERVGELTNAAARIGDVVELITTIAGQTNLLALNATIEAARAGEAGRGFAVVASEVKALADQTAKATGEINQQISNVQNATQESVVAIREIGETIEKLSEISSAIASAVEEQGAATQEISRNVQQAAHGTHQVSSNISDVEHGAHETGSASAQVLTAAQSLAGDSNRLKLEVDKFLDAMRAA